MGRAGVGGGGCARLPRRRPFPGRGRPRATSGRCRRRVSLLTSLCLDAAPVKVCKSLDALWGCGLLCWGQMLSSEKESLFGRRKSSGARSGTLSGGGGGGGLGGTCGTNLNQPHTLSFQKSGRLQGAVPFSALKERRAVVGCPGKGSAAPGLEPWCPRGLSARTRPARVPPGQAAHGEAGARRGQGTVQLLFSDH